MSERSCTLFSFGVEYIRFQRELGESSDFVKDLMLGLMHNMLYWQSHWSPVKSSETIMIEDWNVSYDEFNNLANDIFRMHSAIEQAFKYPEDKHWGIYGLNVVLQNADYFDVSIRKLGDYRIEQWNNDHGAELCPNGALRESACGDRWRIANHNNALPRTSRGRRSK